MSESRSDERDTLFSCERHDSVFYRPLWLSSTRGAKRGARSEERPGRKRRKTSEPESAGGVSRGKLRVLTTRAGVVANEKETEEETETEQRRGNQERARRSGVILHVKKRGRGIVGGRERERGRGREGGIAIRQRVPPWVRHRPAG